MQKVWTQAPRPRLNCHNLSGYDPVSNILARRTTSAPARRRLTFKDAFTILLAPVLATAFVADTSWKDKRRRDWDEKIAEVVAEVDLLRARERQSWCALQHRSIRMGAAHQRRFYATAAHALAHNPDEDFLQPPGWQGVDDFNELDTSRWTGQELGTDAEFVDDDSVKALKRIQRLVAVKMALRMILHVHLGSSPRFGDLNYQYHIDPSGLPSNTEALVAKLKEVRSSLWFMKNAGPKWNTLRPGLSQEQIRLDGRLVELGNKFNKGSLTIPQFVESIAQSILQSTEYPTSKGYVGIMQALSRAGFVDLSYRVIHALDEGSVQLNSSSVFHILWQYGKNQDALNFDKFLRSLTKINRHLDPDSAWEWWRLNDIQVPVPASQDAGLLQMLIYTSLKLDQPHKAEAWASVLREQEYGGQYKTFVINNFLRYYSSRLDWRRGKVWLHIARTWFSSLADHSERGLQRVILSMLNLCVACGKREVYAKIIGNAAKTRIGVFTPDAYNADTFTPRSKAILQEWETLHTNECDRRKGQAEPEHSYNARVHQFQGLLEDELKQFSQGNQSADGTWANPASSKTLSMRDSTGLDRSAGVFADMKEQWQEVHKAQQSELIKLRNELNQAKSLCSSLLMAKERMVVSQPGVEKGLNDIRAQVAEARAHSQALAAVRGAWSAEQSEIKEEVSRLRGELELYRQQQERKDVTAANLHEQLRELRTAPKAVVAPKQPAVTPGMPAIGTPLQRKRSLRRRELSPTQEEPLQSSKEQIQNPPSPQQQSRRSIPPQTNIYQDPGINEQLNSGDGLAPIPAPAGISMDSTSFKSYSSPAMKGPTIRKVSRAFLRVRRTNGIPPQSKISSSDPSTVYVRLGLVD